MKSCTKQFSGLMDPILPVTSASRLSVDDERSTRLDWVVLDATDHAQLGLPNKRLKERVLLAEYRYMYYHTTSLEGYK